MAAFVVPLLASAITPVTELPVADPDSVSVSKFVALPPLIGFVTLFSVVWTFAVIDVVWPVPAFR